MLGMMVSWNVPTTSPCSTATSSSLFGSASMMASMS
jgi:hypothetical protein